MRTTFSKPLNILELADIHLGHRLTSTEHIVYNLMRLIPDNKRTAELDIIFLAGDVFDRDLPLYGEDIGWIRWFASYLLKLCATHDILLRVLEGTPSHDWRQSMIFKTLNDNFNVGCDLKYHQTLEIDYIEKFGIHVLYVPDEWRPTTEQTWREVQELLVKHRLTQVDFAIMHGAFPHQLPPHIHDQVELHDPEAYLAIVKYLIFIGHIHLHSIYDRIIAAGSTDRLVHGEEGPKGIIRAVVHPDGKFSIEFIENKKAKRYVSIECSGMDIDQTLKQVKKKTDDLPPDSHCRIICDPTDPIAGAAKSLKLEFPDFHWKIKKNKSKDAQLKSVELTKAPVVGIALNKESIIKLLKERLSKNDPLLIDASIVAIEEIINDVS